MHTHRYCLLLLFRCQYLPGTHLLLHQKLTSVISAVACSCPSDLLPAFIICQAAPLALLADAYLLLTSCCRQHSTGYLHPQALLADTYLLLTAVVICQAAPPGTSRRDLPTRHSNFLAPSIHLHQDEPLQVAE